MWLWRPQCGHWTLNEDVILTRMTMTTKRTVNVSGQLSSDPSNISICGLCISGLCANFQLNGSALLSKLDVEGGGKGDKMTKGNRLKFS